MALKKNIIHQKNQFLKKEMCAISGTVKQKEVFPIPRHKESILLHVKKINGKNITASFDIIIYLQRDTKILEGDYITIENISLNKKYQAAQLTQKPDFSDFLSKKGISASVFVESLHYKILSRPLRSFRAWVSKTRTKITGALKTKCKPAVFHLFSTIFLGNTQPNKNMMEQKKCFARWGISHFLARSGLHIALFILLWKLFLSFLPIPIFFKHFFLLALCVVYFLFSWPSISFIRALSVFLLFEIGTIFWQRISTLHLLLFTCFFVLALNPLQLFFLDFQLSFSLSIALAWVFQKKTPMAVAKK